MGRIFEVEFAFMSEERPRHKNGLSQTPCQARGTFPDYTLIIVVRRNIGAEKGHENAWVFTGPFLVAEVFY